MFQRFTLKTAVSRHPIDLYCRNLVFVCCAVNNSHFSSFCLPTVLLLPAEATAVLFSAEFSAEYVNIRTAAHSLTKLCTNMYTRTTCTILLNFKVIGQRSRPRGFSVRFCLHDTCGQYLASGEGFTSFILVFVFPQPKVRVTEISVVT